MARAAGTEPLVTARLRGGVGIVTLNRPERHNALTLESFRALKAALGEVAGSGECRVVVLAAAGPSFCSGLDLKSDFGAPGPRGAVGTYDAMRLAVSVILLMREMPQPIIAAVQGHAVGAGFAFATASDLRVAGQDASFNAVFTRIGMTPGDLGLSWFLPRLIGPTAAAEVFYTGGVIDAANAMKLGLVNQVAKDPLAETLGLAEEIASRSPMGVRQTKELLNASLGMSGFREHLEIELRSQVICSMTSDHAEARVAFAENRDPVFTDS